MRVIVILLALLIAYFGWQWFRKSYAEHGRPFAIKVILVAVAIALLGLAMFGRVHWVGAAAATLLAALRFVLPLILRNLPLILNLKKAHAGEKKNNNTTPISSAELNEDDAIAVLGLEKPYTREEIILAHKRIMQNIHPDKGGSDFLASQVNEAKSLLLKILDKKSA